MAKKYVCMGKVARQCSPPNGPFWACANCEARVCNNCKASRGSNRCPVCNRPARMEKIQ